MLQECLNQDIILKDIKKVISFRQKAWLKPYIDVIQNLDKKLKMNLKRTFLNS